jgi:sulfite exporter TauE/SafE
MSIIAILIASFLGSPHCAGMCGGFVALASAEDARTSRQQALYHAGRLTTYSILGGMAGYLGSRFDLAAELGGVQNAAAMVVGALLIFWGAAALFPRLASVKVPGAARIDALRLRFHQALSRWSQRHGRKTFAYCLGLSSTLLPCGWLYSYVAVAAAAGSFENGIIVMLVFWLGTLPLLITIGSLSNLIASPLKAYVPKVIAVLMITAGIFSLSGHIGIHATHAPHAQECHH